MHFCGYCGKKLSDGNPCDCRESVTAAEKQKNRLAAEEIRAAASANKRQLIIGAVCIAVMIIAFIRIIIFIFSGGADESVVRSTRPEYERPIENFVSAYNKNNSEKMMKIMLPSDYIDNLRHIAGSTDEWKEYIIGFNENLEKEKENLELVYGRNVKLSAEIIDRKELKKSEITEITRLYEKTFDTNGLKSAYKIKVEFQTEGSEDYDIDKYWIYVVEIKGDGWLLCPKGDGYNPGSYIGLDFDEPDSSVDSDEK